MAIVNELAEFVTRAGFEQLSPAARLQLRIRILDALGCALGALPGDPVLRVRRYVTAFADDGPCTYIGGGRGAPDRAALLNGFLARYLDFNDSYLAPRETCHPSDNLAAVLAAAELAGADGKTLLTALAVAYQVQCRLSDAAPVRDRGFDHTTHLAYSAAAGAARALGLDAARTASAIAAAGTALNALRVTRTGALSHWKGLAAPFAASQALQMALLAQRGITAPGEVFEGNKGFIQSIAGPFTIDWAHEGLDRVGRTIVKRHNAEIHSQTSIEAALALRRTGELRPEEIARIEIDVFDVAHRIIGGGEEGDKTVVHTKEEADHSLPYMVAVALLDGAVLPPQYAAERINRADVQALLRRVVVRPSEAYSRRFPGEMPSRVAITLADGRTLVQELADYPGFHTRPPTWSEAVEKFTMLAASHAPGTLAGEIADAVRSLDHLRVSELTRLLACTGATGPLATRAAA